MVAATYCEIQNKRTGIATKYKTKEVRLQQNADLINYINQSKE